MVPVSGHDRPLGHVFFVGIRGPCFLRVQMVPRTESAERSQPTGRLNLLKKTEIRLAVLSKYRDSAQ